MHLAEALLLLAAAAVALFAAAGLTFGLSVLYFKTLRRGSTLRWFDLLPFAVLLLSAAGFNVTTMVICGMVQSLTGRQLRPPPPHRWGSPRPGRAP